MNRPFHPAAQWLLFACSIIVMGIWFIFSPFRWDERGWFRQNFGLDSRRVHGQEDSVYRAWQSLRARPTLHNLRNIAHEWTKESPKRAAKFFSFLVVALVITVVLK